LVSEVARAARFDDVEGPGAILRGKTSPVLIDVGAALHRAAAWTDDARVISIVRGDRGHVIATPCVHHRAIQARDFLFD
jgi:hypothetical protein